MFVPVQRRDDNTLVFVNADHIRLIFDEGEVGARIAFAADNGTSDLAIDKTSTIKLLAKLEVAVYKAR